MPALPDENELVLAVVKKILPYGAFCSLPEYKDIEAFLHVSEVAPRWIKNIHEFLSEGQRHVVKVHHVDLQKNQVDISIKRVSEEEKKRKSEQMQNAKRGEKLFEISLKDAGIRSGQAELREKFETQFGDLFSCFKEISANGDKVLDSLDIPPKLRTLLIETAQKNIRKPTVTVAATVNLVCFSSDGVETIKKIFSVRNDFSVLYLGAPRYKVMVTSPEYKSAGKKLSTILDSMEKLAGKSDCVFSFVEEKT